MVMRSPNKEDKLGKATTTAPISTLRADLLSTASNFREKGQYSQAQSIYKQILTSNPVDVDALFGLGLLAKKLKQTDVATAIFEKIIYLDNTNYLAFLQRGLIHSQNNDYDQAISDFDSALAIEPNFFEALSSRGIAFSKQLKFDAALGDFCAAVKLRSDSADAYYNRALAYINLKKFDFAIADYTKAITHNPNHFQALNNRGMALRELRRFDEAIEDFGDCVDLKPDFADGYLNKALTHLMIGDYKIGWKLYEHRWSSANFTSKKRDFDKPLWVGTQSLSGKTILLHSEQGLGDSLQFCRYIKNFKKLKCRVLLEVESPLLGIMENLLPAAQIFKKDSSLPSFDFHCPLMSLPLAFNTTVETIPFSSSYLAADRDRIRWWQEHLGKKKNPRIGLVWRGNPEHPKDQRRSIELASIVNKLTPDFDWYSLQLEISDEEKYLIDQNTHLTHFGRLLGDFAETAALCKVLDAVVCVDTSIAHLCGAIGLPVHLLLGFNADFRWHAEGETTPWYMTTRIYRQETDRCWQRPLQLAIDKIRTSHE